jgi:hypothetical protein
VSVNESERKKSPTTPDRNARGIESGAVGNSEVDDGELESLVV